MTTDTAHIAGYRFDDGTLERSPITLDELDLLKQTVLFGPDDVAALARAGEVLEGRTDQILDVWYGYVGAHPHLARYFSTPDGVLLEDYLGRVRQRFRQWILDACRRPYDQAWLDYQNVIALRHTQVGKNRTDAADSVPEVHLRYMIAFIFPITATMAPFLAADGDPPEQVDAMHAAWFKAVTLHATVWAQPYAPERF
ncbi:MAG TPA: protoglobin domain-containing protein [Geodermatophilus sp.]|nr:protoglobin domain-containing protein [Geodermatophilus sp.]